METDGDTVVFRRSATGKLDCHVNGAPLVIDVIYLELQNDTICFEGTSAVRGTICFGGTSAGSWPSQWRSTPVNSSDAERVLALYKKSANPGVTPLVCRPF